MDNAKNTFPAKKDELDSYIEKVRQQKEKIEVQKLIKDGQQSLAEGKFRKAQATFQRVLDVDPENGNALLGMKKSREEIDKALKLQELQTSRKIQAQATQEREDFTALKKSRKKVLIM